MTPAQRERRRWCRQALTLGGGLLLAGPLASAAEPARLRLGGPVSARIYADAMTALVRAAGFAAEIEFFPAARARQQFLDGLIDLEFPRVDAAIDASYPADTLRIGPLFHTTLVVYARAADTRDQAALMGSRVAHMIGHLLLEKLSAARGLNVTKVSVREQQYKLLMAERVDAVLDEPRLALEVLRANALADQVRIVGEPLATALQYAIMPARARTEAEALQMTLDRWRSSGRWNALMRQANTAHGLPAEMGLLK